MRNTLLAFGLVALLPTAALAQGTFRGAEDGADRGGAAAGPVGAVVGGAVGAATGTVGGVLGVPSGCETRTTRREDDAGNSETVRRSNCP